MVTAESNANGTLISITNWHSYNKPTPDKVTAESNAKGTRSGHKLEGIEGKEVKNKILSDFFEKIWNAYPKKDGKKQAGRHYFATVTNDTDMEQINLALGNYLNHIETNKIELKFIKNGSTWFNNWQDWRIEENGQ
jgi:predicted N-acyltransferase